ncbi:MAG TPA: hypothetical protein VEV41_20350 [Terriglobales bacterium]|nr:hypothetical protein [Terriglobales bacterium]
MGQVSGPSRATAPATTLSAEAPAGVEANRDNATAVQCDDVLDFQDCHSRFPTGCSQASGYDADLNFLKNLLIPPPPGANPAVKYLAQSDYESLDANLPDGLSKNNHADFKDELGKMGEGQLFGVIGYLYYAQPSGVESSNCQLANEDPPEGSNLDYHIGIGFDANLAQQVQAATGKSSAAAKKLLKSLEQNSVIVEMTPHYRFNFEPGVWTIENVKNAVGRQVRVIGQLLVDSEHNLPAQNCAIAKTVKQKQSCWRASVWELHPVVRFQVCKTASCSQDDPNWAELGSS